ncbi:MAG: hypothetical protein FJZ86_18765 [Chloroflexi bacterium]|nr:hypothetical protein [Chloroflexota bacterium]
MEIIVCFGGLLVPLIIIVGIGLIFRQTTEKKIASGAMKVCPHCGNVVIPRGSTCPVCQKTLN